VRQCEMIDMWYVKQPLRRGIWTVWYTKYSCAKSIVWCDRCIKIYDMWKGLYNMEFELCNMWQVRNVEYIYANHYVWNCILYKCVWFHWI